MTKATVPAWVASQFVCEPSGKSSHNFQATTSEADVPLLRLLIQSKGTPSSVAQPVASRASRTLHASVVHDG